MPDLAPHATARAAGMRAAMERLLDPSTAAGLRESHPHDIYITKEAPNYTISPD